ncbi:phenylacetic acid degradation bifunctional protein PaaZ [Alteromonas macleodii]|uniref:phenylacetic acid degradation bifunctional protein PaaZ n=1 Tax=Alteromonas macleodii TaxID=28108 RepID=UPI00207697FD|nr:phenylacetic acid degradation bifunctional protein PaaZ [Alteromonas macleodii]USI26447.1 phenylacetic acid degradation bifunctional protein PaaZ [Alteromonas macleodii]
MKLKNYALGEWFTSSNTGKVVNHAITGLPIAEVESNGLDFSEMLHYARTQGNSALQALTFHQRAKLLKSLGIYLLEQKELFYTCSIGTGTTRKDAWIDIEGGIGTLFSYASQALNSLTDGHILLDGKQEALSKQGSFVGQHIYSSITGAAVHINAYNFPVWGMLEKLAPSIIAGVPVIVKPATQTAFLTELVAQHIVASGILPKGAFQLVCGSLGNMLEHTTYQDVVSFTGSAQTGQMLKAHHNIVTESTRFMMEADSLNCAILGEDVATDSADFNLYIREICNEMTTKAGQKCTAIRRAIVPQDKLEAVIDAIKLRLGKVVIGHPENLSVTMGALAGLEQRADVLASIERLSESAEVVYGSTDLDSFNVLDGDANKGAFLAPVLMVNQDPGCDLSKQTAHDIEAFGPVCTLFSYSNTEHALALAARGKGSLAGSIVTSNYDLAQQLCLGAAAHHGRLLLLNESCSSESTGHGMVLPQLVHGGPGRAGGSEELGGLRAVRHYMQRTALQGNPEMLAAILSNTK